MGVRELSTPLIGVEIGRGAVRAIVLAEDGRVVVSAGEKLVETPSGAAPAEASREPLGDAVPALRRVWSEVGLVAGSVPRVAVSAGARFCGVGSGPTIFDWIASLGSQIGERVVGVGDAGLGVSYCPERFLSQVINAMAAVDVVPERIELPPVAISRSLPVGVSCSLAFDSGVGWRARLQGGRVLEASACPEGMVASGISVSTPGQGSRRLNAVHRLDFGPGGAGHPGGEALFAVAVGAARGLIEPGAGANLASVEVGDAARADPKPPSIDAPGRASREHRSGADHSREPVDHTADHTAQPAAAGSATASIGVQRAPTAHSGPASTGGDWSLAPPADLEVWAEGSPAAGVRSGPADDAATFEAGFPTEVEDAGFPTVDEEVGFPTGDEEEAGDPVARSRREAGDPVARSRREAGDPVARSRRKAGDPVARTRRGVPIPADGPGAGSTSGSVVDAPRVEEDGRSNGHDPAGVVRPGSESAVGESEDRVILGGPPAQVPGRAPSVPENDSVDSAPGPSSALPAIDDSAAAPEYFDSALPDFARPDRAEPPPPPGWSPVDGAPPLPAEEQDQEIIPDGEPLDPWVDPGDDEPVEGWPARGEQVDPGHRAEVAGMPSASPLFEQPSVVGPPPQSASMEQFPPGDVHAVDGASGRIAAEPAVSIQPPAAPFSGPASRQLKLIVFLLLTVAIALTILLFIW